jgi:uncharacterized membrane protein
MRWLGAFLFLLVLNAGLKVWAWQGAHADDFAPTFVQVSDIQVVDQSQAEGKPQGLGDLVGRLHPAIVHFPLAWLVGLALVDFVAFVMGRARWQVFGLPLLGAIVLSLLVAAGTGLLRASHMIMDAGEHAVMVKHRTLNFVVAGLCVLALVLRWRRRDPWAGPGRITYLAIIFAATALVLVSGSLGGRLVYGPDYLPF